MKFETSLPCYSQKYAVRCVLSLIYSLWYLTNSMGLQPTARTVQGWMYLPMGSGVIGFRRPTLMWVCSTSLPHPTETKHWRQCTGSMKLRRSRLTNSKYKRWNTPPSLPLFFQPQDIWATIEATTFYKRMASMLPQKWDSPYSTTLCWLQCCSSYSLFHSSIQTIRGARSSQGHAVRSPTAIDLVTTESHPSVMYSTSPKYHHISSKFPLSVPTCLIYFCLPFWGNVL